MDYFSPKKPHEVQLIQFDFSPLLRKGETVVWCDFAATDMETGDKLDSILRGNGLAQKKSVSVKAGGGEDGKLYRITCNVQTSLGQVLELEGILPVGDAPVAVQELSAPAVVEPEAKEVEAPKILFKSIPLREMKTDVIERNGVKIGIVQGYASTYDEDLVGDIVVKGAFAKSISYQISIDRPVKMLYEHDDEHLIGIFDPKKMFEDEKGLFVVGEVNLEVEKGSDVHALLRQGALADFSIGYMANDYSYDARGRRLLKEIQLVEISVVGRPANPQAVVTAVKKDLSEVKEAFSSKRDAEKLLRENGFSRSASTYISSLLNLEEKSATVEHKTVLDALEEVGTLAKKVNGPEDAQLILDLYQYVSEESKKENYGNLPAFIQQLKDAQ